MFDAGRVQRVNLLRDEGEIEPLLEEKCRKLRDVLGHAGRGRLVIGLSGGIDSAVAMALAARALGAEHVVAVRMPSRHTEQVHLDDAAASAVAAGLPDENLLTVSIEPVLDGLSSARPTVAGSDIRFGNASARSRMLIVYDLAQGCTRLSSAPRTGARTCSATSRASEMRPPTSSRSAICTRPRCDWRRECSASRRR